LLGGARTIYRRLQPADDALLEEEEAQ